MSDSIPASAPLTGIKVIEIASLAPGPFGCMILADLGADVVRVDRPTRDNDGLDINPLQRNRRSIVLNLKDPRAAAVLLRLIDEADVLVEGFRPGVAERLGFGPDICLGRNPRIVYARMTGWGQRGPLAETAGHDIDFIALSGALAPIGPADRCPTPPLNYIGDFGGGGMLLAIGVLAALLERHRSGLGQVIDVAMVDGSSLLTTALHGLRAAGRWSDERGRNLVDGGAPFYRCYETADRRYMAVGAIEPQFYAAFIQGLGLDAALLPTQHDVVSWHALHELFGATFLTRSQAEWVSIFSGSNACVAPVLPPVEAPIHPHNVARNSFVEVDGIVQPAPAPRFGRSVIPTPTAPPRPGKDTHDVLNALGYSGEEQAALYELGIAAR